MALYLTHSKFTVNDNLFLFVAMVVMAVMVLEDLGSKQRAKYERKKKVIFRIYCIVHKLSPRVVWL